MPSASDRTGSPSSPLTPLEPVLDFARAWAGGDRLALIVSGSHASGEAVWAEHEGRRVSLSDLDVVAVVPDAAAKRAARERARAASDGLATRLLALGLAAPLEVGFHTPADLERMPARPATLELRRHGAVIEGDPSWLARVPTWSARDVSAEETLLLLENRGFELIGAECLRDRAGLAALQRRHAVLKTALDLAGIEALAAGEYPDGAAARVARARAHRDRDPAHEPPWDEALAWRAGVLTGDGGAAAEGELARTIAAWVGLWRRRVGDPGDPARPFAAIARVAARARARRRVREAVDAGRAGHAATGLLRRVAFAARGTPQHRLNASAAAYLIARAAGIARGGAPDPALARDCARVLRSLGIVSGGDATARELFAAWNRGVAGGRRTEAGR